MAENIKFISLENLGLYDEKSKALMDAKDAEILEQAKAHAEDLSDIYDAAGSAATAESNAKAHAEEKVGELATYVGTIPEGYAQETVIAYINKKAEETLSAAHGGSSETAASVKQALETYKAENDPKVAALEGDVAAIKGDYLKASDKEALQNSIDGVAEDVATIKGDYLKAADKSELQGDLESVYKQFPRLLERRRQIAGTLSGGEQQMLAVGRALMSRPKVMMMDEPSLGLAPIIVKGIFDIIKEINTDDDDMNSFLFRLGCYPGEPITLISKKKKSCIVVIKDGRYTEFIESYTNKTYPEGDFVDTNGKILDKCYGENGFGYDPIFVVGDRTSAEMSPAEKDALSHRGNALRVFSKDLAAYLAQNK